MFKGTYIVIPIEAVLATIEIKSIIDRSEVEKIVENLASTYVLKPFGQKQDLSFAKGKGVDFRIFRSVFAFDSDTSQHTWAKTELQRFREEFNKQGVPLKLLDRLYVLNRGVIQPNAASYAVDEPEQHRGLLYYYSHLLSVVTRENKRRKATPYLNYLGRLSQGWNRIT